MADFDMEVSDRISTYSSNTELRAAAREFMEISADAKYSYNFRWLGRPIIQHPQDIVAVQEIIWRTRPDLIIETGIARGGSLILSASMLAMLDMSDAIESGSELDPRSSFRRVLGVDIDIRAHNRKAIERHPMSSRIQMIEGSSIATNVIDEVKEIASGYKSVLVFLDSNHTHEHVFAELTAYAPLIKVGSYCIVFDTAIEDMPGNMFQDRPWGPGNSPKTAVREYLKEHPEFEVDKNIQDKLLITVVPDGYLRRSR